MNHQEFLTLIEQLDYSSPLTDLSKKDRDQVSELLKIGSISKTDYNSSNEDARKNLLSNAIAKVNPSGTSLNALFDDDDDGFGIAGMIGATKNKSSKGLEIVTASHISVNLNAKYYKTDETGQVNISLCVLTQTNGKKIPGAVYMDAVNDGMNIVFQIKVSGEMVEIAKLLMSDVPKFKEAGKIDIKFNDNIEFLAAKKANGNAKECKFIIKGSEEQPTARIYIPFKSMDLA
ncbi:MAG: hypothetical protein KBG30_12185 [Bacteroidales bacterium]|nr:hypothetical protein [Bacteroidales bacterium]